MARDAFVKTTTKRLDLTGDWEGEWVEVKEHLGVADQQRINGSAFTTVKNMGPDVSPEEAEAGIDLGNLYRTQLKTYLVGWSFRTSDGQPVPYTATAVDMLDPDCADEIQARLKVWLAEVRAAREANPTNTKTKSGQHSA